MDKPRLHWVPERKFLAGGLAGIAAWLVSLVTVRYLGIDVPLEVLGPFIMAAGTSAYYLVPPSAQDVLRRIDGDLKAAFKLPDVKGTTAKLAVAILLLGGLGLGGPIACANYELRNAEAASPAQRMFALQADYNTALYATLGYLESGYATSEAKRVIARMDQVAFQAVTGAADAVRSGDSLAIPVSTAAARAALDELIAYLAARKRDGPGGPPSPPAAAGQGAGT